MKCWLVAFLIVFAVASTALAAKGPEINLIDNRLSINADSISLGRLLRLLDLATGMQSKVPPELANRNISVRFSGLTLEDGVRKIFQGQPFDYLLFAKLTSGTTRENHDYQRDYELTLELVDIRSGEQDKQSAMLSKGYHHSWTSRAFSSGWPFAKK